MLIFLFDDGIMLANMQVNVRLYKVRHKQYTYASTRNVVKKKILVGKFEKGCQSAINYFLAIAKQARAISSTVSPKDEKGD